MADENDLIGDDDAPVQTGAPDVLTSRKASLEQPYREGEMELVERVEGFYSDAEKGKQDLCEPDTWEESLDVYWGEDGPANLPLYKPRVKVNELQSLVLQELSDLTDSKTRVYVEKKGELDVQRERALQAYWTRAHVDLKVLLACLDAMVYPLGFIQRGWDPLAAQGQGQVLLRHRDPNTVFPDPDAEDETDCRFTVLEDVEDLIQIRRDYPETGWLVKPEDAYSVKAQTDRQRMAPRAAGYVGPMYSQTLAGSGVPGFTKARARILTCIVDDDDLVEEIQELGGELRAVTKMKYPHRRLMIVANRRMLYDGDCPFHLAPLITRVALQPSIHAYWPRRSIISQWMNVQQTAEKSDALVAENILRVNVGDVFADANSGLNPKTYGQIPGAVYLITPGSRVVKNNGVPLDPNFMSYGERLRGYIRTGLGFPLSRTGAGTHGNVAAELAETEISQSMGLTRLRGRLLHESVQTIVEMIFGTMAQFYTVPRHMPYIEGGQWKSVQWEPVADPNDYAVQVDPASFQVRSKTMMQRLALALAKMGRLPTERLLQILEFPDAKMIAEEQKAELILQAAANMKKNRKK